jgi:phage gp46-like protein
MIQLNDSFLELDNEKGYFDISLLPDGTDLKRAGNLESSIAISLFTDRRSLNDDIDPNARGWCGDSLQEVGEHLIGSRLWLFGRRKIVDSIVPEITDIANESLQWLVDNKIAASFRVITTIADRAKGLIRLDIDITRITGENQRFEYVWEILTV